jgi:hypothetical protein
MEIMPPSLSKGTSKIVPVKMPDDEKQAAKSVLQTGETLSGFMREAARLLVKKRNSGTKSCQHTTAASVDQSSTATKPKRSVDDQGS